MNIKYNAATGDLKIRPSIRTILAVGVTLAGVKFVYDFGVALNLVALRYANKGLAKLDKKEN